MSTLKVDTLDTSNGTGNITLSRPIVGDGSNLTGVAPTKTTIEALGIDVPAANLTGTVADARFPVTLPASSGVNLTALNASNITSGTLPAGRYTDTVYTHPTTAGNKHIPTAGATDQVLTYSSSGTASWADPASGVTTATGTATFLTDSTGDQSVTGLGFRPSTVFLNTSSGPSFVNRWSFGFTVGNNDRSICTYSQDHKTYASGGQIYIGWESSSSSAFWQGNITTMDADGFTWNKTSLYNPASATIYVYWLAFK